MISTELVSRGKVIPESGSVHVSAVSSLIYNVEFLLVILVRDNLELRGFVLFRCCGEFTSITFHQVDSLARFHIVGCYVVWSNCMGVNKGSVINQYMHA